MTPSSFAEFERDLHEARDAAILELVDNPPSRFGRPQRAVHIKEVLRHACKVTGTAEIGWLDHRIGELIREGILVYRAGRLSRPDQGRPDANQDPAHAP